MGEFQLTCGFLEIAIRHGPYQERRSTPCSGPWARPETPCAGLGQGPRKGGRKGTGNGAGKGLEWWEKMGRTIQNDGFLWI